jgi:chromosome segregation ATPase
MSAEKQVLQAIIQAMVRNVEYWQSTLARAEAQLQSIHERITYIRQQLAAAQTSLAEAQRKYARLETKFAQTHQR